MFLVFVLFVMLVKTIVLFDLIHLNLYNTNLNYAIFPNHLLHILMIPYKHQSLVNNIQAMLLI